jgi:His/Glu/Gln/Arg/opine family amino acid ABC transporter permease subunit
MWFDFRSDALLAVLDFSVFLSPSPEAGTNYLTYLLGGALWTVILSVLNWVIAFVIGSVIGVFRTPILSKVGACYVEIFRNIPLLVQLFIWFNVVPELLPGFGPWYKHLPSFLAAVYQCDALPRPIYRRKNCRTGPFWTAIARERSVRCWIGLRLEHQAGLQSRSASGCLPYHHPNADLRVLEFD